jgi:hypothetical protein
VGRGLRLELEMGETLDQHKQKVVLVRIGDEGR